MTEEAKQVDNVVASATSGQGVDNNRKKLDDDTDQDEIDSQEISRQGHSSTNHEPSSAHSHRSSRAALKQKTQVLKKRTAHVIKEGSHVIKARTVHTYHNASWCALPRWLGQTPRNWPRVTSFIFGIIVPLWMLIGLAAGFGFLLAGCEDGQEIES
jgi:protein required for attachment to host cells